MNEKINMEWADIYELIAKNAKAETQLETLRAVFSNKEIYQSMMIELALSILGIEKEAEQ